MKPESKISFLILSVVLISILIGQVSLIPLSVVNPVSDQTDKRDNPNVDYLQETSNLGSGYSNLTLSIVFDDTTSSVEGNLTVDFYNNDPHNFTRIPFHLYLSGMVYESRSGSITILNVTDFANPNIALPFEVIDNEVLWVNLSETLEPMMRVQFIISFTAIIPDGGMDRANSHGADFDQSRIYKFAHFYPIPCVHDRFDGWNTDPYLSTGDPFYFDMAYYQFYIEAPNSMVIAATGKLMSKTNKGATNLYHYDPLYPVR